MTDTHPHPIFVYGTLKSGYGNNGLLERYKSQFLGPAITVEKFVLNDTFPYVFYNPPAEKRFNRYLGIVRGELYRVTDDGLRACDALEGHPTGYCRTPIEVSYFVDGPGEQTVTAGIYLMRWNRWGIDPQMPDENGFVEWGRDTESRNFQRESSRKYRDRL